LFFTSLSINWLMLMSFPIQSRRAAKPLLEIYVA